MIRLLTNLEFPGAPDTERQRQPAGFDLTLREVSRFLGRGAIDLTNEQRRLPNIQPMPWPEEPPMVLQPGGYLLTYNEEIHVPKDCAGIVLPRSTLMRCGATLHTALWDPGYRGRGQGLLAVFNQLALYPDARIGQFVLIGLEQPANETYKGAYQNENL
jgi:dUTP pyrophosphatase